MGLRKLTHIAGFLAVSLALTGCGSSGSQPGPMIVSAAAPSIITQPGNQTVSAGQPATFSVTAQGTTPLSYQWQKGTAGIAGATSASYTIAATTTAESGSQYSVVVSNAIGTSQRRPRITKGALLRNNDRGGLRKRGASKDREEQDGA